VDFRFTTDRIWERADEIISYLLGPRLWIPKVDYPDFENWLGRVHIQLKSEEKRAVIALSSGYIVGAIIYQRHQELEETLEVKNITVRPDMRGRLVASFLLRSAEMEGHRDFGCRRVVVDAKAKNIGIRAYLFKNGYSPEKMEDLYGLGSGEDVVYGKILRIP
jgi:GNAT superfamily N-acetyltransferase